MKWLWQPVPDAQQARVRAAANRRTDPATLLGFVDDETAVQVVLAGNPACPDEALVALASCGHEQVAEALATRNASPGTRVHRLVETNRHNGFALLTDVVEVPVEQGGRFSAEVMAAYAASGHVRLAEAVAGQPDAEPALLETLAEHPDVWVRAHLAGNVAVTGERLLRVAERGGSEALQVMAQRDDLSVEVVEAVAVSRSTLAHALLVANPMYRSWVVDSESAKVRAMVARHVADDDEVTWGRLLDDGSPVVRAAAARAMGAGRVDVQADHPCVKVRQVVAERSVTTAVLGRLALDPEALVRRRVAKNPAADMATLNLMARDGDAVTRRHAGERFLAALAGDA